MEDNTEHTILRTYRRMAGAPFHIFQLTFNPHKTGFFVNTCNSDLPDGIHGSTDPKQVSDIAKGVLGQMIVEGGSFNLCSYHFHWGVPSRKVNILFIFRGEGSRLGRVVVTTFLEMDVLKGVARGDPI